ncbi:MAG: threonine/serine exporter family protein [Odoribacteraceae bacterium]|nr:threonine/serine exporter family protein [Odoribacteraceae bacterium]
MKTDEQLKDIARFIAEYATCLLGSGVHTSRVIRNSCRIGESLGVAIKMSTFQKTIVLTTRDQQSGDVHTEVIDIPSLPVNFAYNADLSALSWEARDEHLPLATLRDKFHRVTSRPPLPPRLVLLLVGLANASFCRLFGGSWSAVGIVFLATLAGVLTRQHMQRRGVNHFIIFTLAALVSSTLAASALAFDATAEIALATSVLFLIPGVPLVNGVIDIVEGHAVIGFSRLTHAFLVIICITVGLSCPLLLFKTSLP